MERLPGRRLFPEKPSRFLDFPNTFNRKRWLLSLGSVAVAGSVALATLTGATTVDAYNSKPEQTANTIKISSQVEEGDVVSVTINTGRNFTHLYRNIWYSLFEASNEKGVILTATPFAENFPAVVNLKGLVKSAKGDSSLEIEPGETYRLEGIASEFTTGQPSMDGPVVVEKYFTTPNFPGQIVVEPDSNLTYPQCGGEVNGFNYRSEDTVIVQRTVKDERLTWSAESDGPLGQCPNPQ